VINLGTKRRAEGQPGAVGKLFLSLFFLVFFAAGALFTAMMLREVFRVAATWSWQKVECEIVASTVVERRDSRSDNAPYWFEVQFSYSFNGAAYISGGHRRNPGGFSDYSTAQRLAEKYPAESKHSCYVNPSNPSEAVLERQSLWLAMALPFPLIFVAIGAGGIFFTWTKRASATRAEEKKPISSLATASTGTKFMACFFAVFLIVGLGTFHGFFVRPMAKIIDARGWMETPCVVVSSEVRSHRGDDSTTYSVDILYSYTVNGKEYKSNRYHFMGGSSSGYRGKAEIVNRHPPGARAVCYVNPRDPTDAVLRRGFTNDLWLGLIPLPFVLVGAGGILFALRAARRGEATTPELRWLPNEARPSGVTGWSAPAMPDTTSSRGPVVLKPSASPWTKLIGSIFFAAFWNGIVSVFVFQAFQGWQKGRPEWFLIVFLIPFVLIGLVIIGAVGYFLLALFNPRPVLTVNSKAVPLGGTLDLQWRLSGRVHAVQRLRLYLEGREEATYRRGTSSCTDKEVFATVELADVTSQNEKRAGQCRVTVPADLMHSFESGNNKIVWSLNIHGDIRWWPDVKEEFPLVVLPSAAQPPVRT
jgi:uncharacterized protein DUF3592